MFFSIIQYLGEISSRFNDNSTWIHVSCLLWAKKKSQSMDDHNVSFFYHRFFLYQSVNCKVLQINRTMNSRPSPDVKKQEFSLQLQKNSPQITSQTRLQFDRKQADQLYVQHKKHEFGQFVAREAVLDEEYWVIVCKF